MSTTFRVTIAALLLGVVALVLTAGADPRAVGVHAAAGLIVLMVHVWAIAVGERSCPDRGGSEVPRFGLGARLVTGGAGLARQLVVPVLLIGMATRDPLLSVIGLVVLGVLATEGLRRLLPFVIPGAVAIYSITAMEEFHTFGDLIDSAKAWITTAVAVLLGALVVAGPLLRTDVGGTLTRRGRMMSLVAGLPTYLLGVVVASQGLFGGMAPPEMYALGLAILVGGVLQSLVAGLSARGADLEMRHIEDYPWVVASDVGKGVSVMFLPIFGLILMGWVPVAPAWAAFASQAAWIGLAALFLVVPSVCAAVWVGWAVDRADGRWVKSTAPLLAGSAFAAWFLLGPACLEVMYRPGGVIDMFAAALPAAPRPLPMDVGTGGGASLLSRDLLGGTTTMHGVPVADLCRAMALMVGAAAWLAVRTLRHTVPEYEGARWGNVGIAAALSAALAWVLAPRLGPAGVPLGTAVACALVVALDAVQVHHPIEDPDALEGDEEAMEPLEAPESPAGLPGLPGPV